MRTVTIITTSRADYGIYGPILRRLTKRLDLDFDLMVTGSHLSPIYGNTVERIERDGYPIRDRIECLMANDSPGAVAQAMGLTMLGFSQAYARRKPEMLLVLGDRFEMFAAAAAAVPFMIPIAHIHGGETTEGAIDEAFRHSLTKMSHLHFAATQTYHDRILQLGEDPWRVTLSGAPSLDNLRDLELLAKDTLENTLGLSLAERPLIVTYHPVTLQHQQTAAQFDALLSALDRFPHPIIFSYPNADTNGQIIIEKINSCIAARSNSFATASLGTQAYFSLMGFAAAMVGNSSSGIIEAASFGLPVVNIGIRQLGRDHGQNVIDCDDDETAISSAIRKAISDEFRLDLADLVNPYGDGCASDRIVERLAGIVSDEKLLQKRFCRV